MELTSEQLRLERRARRDARRAKQRIQNVVRARQMREARLVVEQTTKRSQTPAKKVAARPITMVGCSGWYYWHWKGIFYPSDLPSKNWFGFYASKFRTVELNAPFYSWPTVATVKTWLRQAKGRRFVYTVKVNELITHEKRMVGTAQLVKDFYYIADLLGTRMGCFLFQFPPSFKYSAASLNRLVKQLDPRHRNVVEFRHRSWWNEKVYAALRKANIAFCSSSGPRMPDELVSTSKDLYIRFHGTTRWYRHDYTNAELQVWVDRIRANDGQNIWAYFNNDRDGHAIMNAKAFMRLLRKTKR